MKHDNSDMHWTDLTVNELHSNTSYIDFSFSSTHPSIHPKKMIIERMIVMMPFTAAATATTTTTMRKKPQVVAAANIEVLMTVMVVLLIMLTTGCGTVPSSSSSTTTTSSSTTIMKNHNRELKQQHLLQQVSAFSTTTIPSSSSSSGAVAFAAARRNRHHRHGHLHPFLSWSFSLPQQQQQRRQLQALKSANDDDSDDSNVHDSDEDSNESNNNANNSQGKYNNGTTSQSDGRSITYGFFTGNDRDDKSQQVKSEGEKIRNVLPLFEMYNRMHPKATTTTNSTGSSTSSNKKNDDDASSIIVTEDTIKSLFVLFNSALATGVAKIVAKRYADDAVLLPCTSEGPRMTQQEIEEYYEQYLVEKPQKKVIVLEGNNNNNNNNNGSGGNSGSSRRIRIGHDKTWAEDTGICEITFRAPRDGSTVPRRALARYSFVYTYDSSVGQWRIMHHHSSLLDSSSSSEEGSPGPRRTGQFPVSNQKTKVPSSWSGPMTIERVQNLFQLFIQDTWARGDADTAASRFHRDEGLLVPLNVYDRPRMGYDDIRDYFDDFLYEVRPVISKVERTAITLNDESKEKQKWAKDVGTMQITFRKDYSTMDVRYSVDYILDDLDGQWKILQLHTTPLPKEWHQLRVPSQSNRRRSVDPSMDYEDTISTSATSQSRTVPPLSSSFSGLEQGATASRLVTTPIVTETDVHSWFDEWNAALATGDADAVANRYGEKAILVPSLSYSNPRTTPAAIKEYYRVFLWSRPQATVVQRHVTISEHFVKDVGVLEYSFKDRPDAGRVKERFSFLYLFDAIGGWKIMHHQQSVVTEEIQDAGTIEDDSGASFFQ